MPHGVTSCAIPVPSDYVIDATISVYADGVLTDSKQYVDAAPAANTFVNNFISGFGASSYFTFKDVAIGLLVQDQVDISIDSTNGGLMSSDTVTCSTSEPATNTVLNTACTRDGNDYKCNFYSAFATAARYADITCAIFTYFSGSHTDIVFTGPGNSTVNIGRAKTTARKPTATMSLSASGLSAPITAGTDATLRFALYDAWMVKGDNVSISFTDADMQDIDFFAMSTDDIEMAGFVTTRNATHVTFTATESNLPMPYVASFNLTTVAAVDYTPRVVIVNGKGNTSAPSTVNVSMITMPDMYEYANTITPIPGPNDTSIAVAINTNQPQVVEIEVVPGSIDGEFIINNAAFEGESNCGDVTQDADGVYRVWANVTELPVGTNLNCTFVMTIEKSFFCTGDDCASAPQISVFSRNPDIVFPLTYIPFGEATIKLVRTRGAFTSDMAGFVIYASYFPAGSSVTINNDFGLTAPIDVYAVTDTEVGETPVGSAASDGNGNLVITVNDLISSDGLEGFSGYVAVPVFNGAQVLPTMKDVEITANVNTTTSAPIIFSNGDAVIELTPAEFTAPVRENTEFFVNFTLTSTHLDELTAKIDFSATGATFNDCENHSSGGMPAAYVAAAMKLTDDVPEAEAEDGILTVPIPKTDATVEDGFAKYSYMCSFTAGAYAKGKTDATVPIDVMFGTTVVKTADLTVPAPSRLPVAGTKLSVSIVRDTLFTSAELTAILNALVKTMQAIDPTFDISRLYGITQKLNVYSPSAIHVAAGSTVTLSTSFTGVTVTDTAALAADTKSSVEALGYEADVDVEGADIEVTCTEGCGTEECGLCLDGNACTDAAQCFSGKCGGGVCGRDNSAASVSVALCAALAVFASIMLF
jgi:hypothetical protein